MTKGSAYNQNYTVILRLADYAVCLVQESALLCARLEWHEHKKDPFATLRMTKGNAYNQNYTVILSKAITQYALCKNLL